MNISPITVLIVDDSRIFRSALEECLSELDDIKVIGSVFNGEEALKFIGSKRPDVVTLDVEMPGINGLEVLKRILKNNTEHPDEPIIKVLMLSAFTKKGADITMEALEIGAYDFLTKPNSTSPQEGIKLLKNSILCLNGSAIFCKSSNDKLRDLTLMCSITSSLMPILMAI